VFLATLVVGLVIFGVAAAHGYGIHRDELYFIDCGKFLDWGYVDHSLVLPLAARLLGGNLALMQLAVIAAVAGLAAAGAEWGRRLGGTIAQQWLTAILFLSMPGLIGGAATFGTVVFEQLGAAWLGVAFVRFRQSPTRLALFELILMAFVVGLVKPSGILLSATFAVVMFIHYRKLGWRSVGVVAASLIGAAPFFSWQANHGWPIMEFTAAQRSDRPPLAIYLVMALIMLGPVGIAATTVCRRTIGRSWALWFAIAGIALFAILQGKPYYAVSFFFPLLAEVASVLPAARRWFSAGVIGILIGIGLLLPVWPRHQVGQSFLPLQSSSRERVDWIEWVEKLQQIAITHGATATITSNYGQAAALRQLGDGSVTPICGHNQNAFWPSPPINSDPMIAIGYSRRWLELRFVRVESVGILRNQYGVPNEEEGRTVWRVQDRRPGVDLSRDLRHFD